jgi:hypothetical protein
VTALVASKRLRRRKSAMPLAGMTKMQADARSTDSPRSARLAGAAACKSDSITGHDLAYLIHIRRRASLWKCLPKLPPIALESPGRDDDADPCAGCRGITQRMGAASFHKDTGTGASAEAATIDGERQYSV